MEEKIRKDFLEFVNKVPNAYLCIEYLKKYFINNGYEELFECNKWDNLKNDGKYFVIRNDSSLIAFKMNDNDNISFNITSTHTDSPSFTIKNNPEIFENGYLKLNTSGYGGMINYSWLDRPLSLAGRVIVWDNGVYKKYMINIDKDLLVIPSQAIHMNRDVNSNNELNHQIDMLPVMSLTNQKLEDIIKEQLNKENKSFTGICDYDLYLYNRDIAKICGLNDEFILSPRLDDLGCVYPALFSFINSNNYNKVNVFCAFNNEEIGSMTIQGAYSTFLNDVLSRICNFKNVDLHVALNNSFIVSADNAHAIHPNVPSKSDPTNKVFLNNGIVIKHHINYTTDALTSSLFKGICINANIPYQDFCCRSDLKCGSTLGRISQTQVSVNSIDIGLPQLSMHSANELMGSLDIIYMYKVLLEFYNSSIIGDSITYRIEK